MAWSLYFFPLYLLYRHSTLHDIDSHFLSSTKIPLWEELLSTGISTMPLEVREKHVGEWMRN